MNRRHLPDTRPSLTSRIEHVGELDIYVTVGFYEDNTPGEVFIKIAKEGSTLAGLIDIIAVCMSLMLQYEVPWDRVSKKFRNTNFEPLNAEGKSIAHAIVTTVDRLITLKREQKVSSEADPNP